MNVMYIFYVNCAGLYVYLSRIILQLTAHRYCKKYYIVFGKKIMCTYPKLVNDILIHMLLLFF